MRSESVAKPRGGNGMDGGDMAMNQEEPGAVDNRLSITPSDFPVTEEWEDGEIYNLSELGSGVRIRQISPGEFEVIPGTPANGSEEEGAEPGEEEAPAMKELMSKY